jgi:uncharacterized protein
MCVIYCECGAWNEMDNGSSSIKWKATNDLFDALRSNDASAVHSAFARGAYISARQLNGMTPLHVGVCHESVDAVRALLSHGPALDAGDGHLTAPLHYAVSACVTPAIAELLIAAGADINITDGRGHSPLDWAAGAGRLGAAKVLLQAGAITAGRNQKWCESVLNRDGSGADGKLGR